MDSLGFTWPRLDSFGFTWTHSVSLRFHLDSLGLTWIHLESHGLTGISLGFTCILKGKGKTRCGQKGKGNTWRAKKGKGKGEPRELHCISTRQTDRAHARTNRNRNRFPGWTHPPTSDLHGSGAGVSRFCRYSRRARSFCCSQAEAGKRILSLFPTIPIILLISS